MSCPGGFGSKSVKLNFFVHVLGEIWAFFTVFIL